MGSDLTSRPDYENGQEIRDRTFAFSCRVVNFCQHLFERVASLV
jgi:hypothetical protein